MRRSKIFVEGVCKGLDREELKARTKKQMAKNLVDSLGETGV